MRSPSTVFTHTMLFGYCLISWFLRSLLVFIAQKTPRGPSSKVAHRRPGLFRTARALRGHCLGLRGLLRCCAGRISIFVGSVWPARCVHFLTSHAFRSALAYISWTYIGLGFILPFLCKNDALAWASCTCCSKSMLWPLRGAFFGTMQNLRSRVCVVHFFGKVGFSLAHRAHF